MRRKNAAASRSSTKKPTGELASQPDRLSSSMVRVEPLAAQAGVEEVELRQIQLGHGRHGLQP